MILPIAALPLLLAAPLARADVAPPPDIPRSNECSASARQGRYEECVECLAPPLRADRCTAPLSAYGFSKECSRRKGLLRNEVFCRSRSPTAPSLPTEMYTFLTDTHASTPPPPSTIPEVPLDDPLNDDPSWRCSSTGRTAGLSLAVVLAAAGAMVGRRSGKCGTGRGPFVEGGRNGTL
jgi:hypothetical protein